MTDHSHIDEAFRNHRRDWEKAPADMVWHRLTDRLDEYRPRRRQRKNTIFRIGMAAALVMVFGLSFLWYSALTPDTAEIAGLTDHSLEEIEVAIPAAPPEQSANATSAPDSPAPALAAGTAPVERQPSVVNANTTHSSAQIVRQPDIEAAGGAESTAAALEAGTSASPVTPGEAIAVRGAAEERMDDAMAIEPGHPVQTLSDQAERSAAKSASASREIRKREGRSDAKANSYMSGDHDAAIESPEDEMKTGSGFVRESLTILVPAGEGNKCAQYMIYLEADRYYTSPCPLSAAAIKQTAPTYPESEDPLLRLLHEKEDFLQEMESYGADKNCSTEENIKLIYGLGTDLSALKDTVLWPATPSCMSENASLIYLKIKEILSMGK